MATPSILGVALAIHPFGDGEFKNRIFAVNRAVRERAIIFKKSKNMDEAIVWNDVNQGRLYGRDFDHKKIIGNGIADLYCTHFGLVIEIDGKSQILKNDDDPKKDIVLTAIGRTVIQIQYTPRGLRLGVSRLTPCGTLTQIWRK